MSENARLTVGQDLWFVPSRRYRQPALIKVTKVGRKWAETNLSDVRLDLETLHADGRGYSSPGRAWLSEALWNADKALEGAWGDFRRAVDKMYGPPDGVTIGNIRAAEVLLKLARGEAS